MCSLALSLSTGCEINLCGTTLRGNVRRVQHQIAHAEKARTALKWDELYQSWRSNIHEYPELNDLPTFIEIQWPSGIYWVPARPTEASSLTEREYSWVDWWPRAEVASRTEFLAKKTSYGTWRSAFPQLPEACRYTLHYLWAARQDPELTAAVWLAATMLMWESSRREHGGWDGSAYQLRQRVRHLGLEQMEKRRTGSWLHTCKYPLPEAVTRFIRAPSYMHEIVEMAATNAVFIHNRWTLVRLCHVESSDMTKPVNAS